MGRKETQGKLLEKPTTNFKCMTELAQVYKSLWHDLNIVVKHARVNT